MNDLGFRSWTDATAASHPLMAKMDGWRVHADLENGPDHRIITFQIKFKLSKGVASQCQNWGKVNWMDFQAKLMTRLHGHSDLTEVPGSRSAVDDFERCPTSKHSDNTQPSGPNEENL